jgi:hypothetical protein
MVSQPLWPLHFFGWRIGFVPVAAGNIMAASALRKSKCGFFSGVRGVGWYIDRSVALATQPISWVSDKLLRRPRLLPLSTRTLVLCSRAGTKSSIALSFHLP